MFPNEQQIQKIVEDVIKKMNVGPVRGHGATAVSLSPAGGIFQNVADAVRAASLAYREYKKVPLQKRHEIISAIREAAIKNAEMMARESAEETKMGRVADKIQKILL
ncbi:MAG TPA: aldehyde dehydrogenase EutE, partial [Candidatus Wallbacteria bacterium]|nr:aldehyde dehydrogenase EutE [Candidatus Wallbacteria bacterium]